MIKSGSIFDQIFPHRLTFPIDLPEKPGMSRLTPKEIESLVSLQDFILETTSENVDATVEALVPSWVLSTRSVERIGTAILVAASYRPCQIPALASLASTLSSLACSSNSLGELCPYMLTSLFRSFRYSKPFPNESTNFSFLYEAFSAKLFTRAELHACIAAIGQEPAFIRSLCWLVCYFAPELDRVDSVLCRDLLGKLQRASAQRHFPQIFKNFSETLDRLRRFNWRLLKKRRNFFTHKKTLLSRIREDDIDALRLAAISPRFSTETRILPTAFTPTPFLQAHPTLIQVAAFFGSVRCFRFLISCGAELRVVDNNNWTLPQFAAAGGDIEIIRICQQFNLDAFGVLHVCVRFHLNDLFDFFRQSVDPDDRDLEGETPLHAACESNNLYAISILDGLDQNVSSSRGWTPLRMAVRRGFIDCTRHLLGDEAVHVDLPSQSGHTPLHLAAKHGDVRLVKMLIARGASVNARTIEGFTPFLLACFHGQDAVVKHLLSIEEVDPNARAMDRSTGLMMAVSGSYDRVAGRLIKCRRVDINAVATEFFGPLFLAIRGARMNVIQWLLGRDDINLRLKSNSGATFLHLVMREAAIEIAQWLLEMDQIDVNAADCLGITPLHKAVAQGSLRLVNMLLREPDIDVNCLDGMKNSPLAMAAQHLSVMSRLLKRDDILINRIERNGMAPIHTFANDNSIDAMRRLCKRADLDVNMRALDGGRWTALMIAAAKGHKDIIRVLLDRADVAIGARSDSGQTAVVIAKMKGHTECVDLFRPQKFASTPGLRPRRESGAVKDVREKNP
jgi:ankyrin repeat protein